jgi:hypothetical protein
MGNPLLIVWGALSVSHSRDETTPVIGDRVSALTYATASCRLPVHIRCQYTLAIDVA